MKNQCSGHMRARKQYALKMAGLSSTGQEAVVRPNPMFLKHLCERRKELELGNCHEVDIEQALVETNNNVDGAARVLQRRFNGQIKLASRELSLHEVFQIHRDLRLYSTKPLQCLAQRAQEFGATSYLLQKLNMEQPSVSACFFDVYVGARALVLWGSKWMSGMVVILRDKDEKGNEVHRVKIDETGEDVWVQPGEQEHMWPHVCFWCACATCQMKLCHDIHVEVGDNPFLTTSEEFRAVLQLQSRIKCAEKVTSRTSHLGNDENLGFTDKADDEIGPNDAVEACEDSVEDSASNNECAYVCNGCLSWYFSLDDVQECENRCGVSLPMNETKSETNSSIATSQVSAMPTQHSKERFEKRGLLQINFQKAKKEWQREPQTAAVYRYEGNPHKQHGPTFLLLFDNSVYCTDQPDMRSIITGWRNFDAGDLAVIHHHDALAYRGGKLIRFDTNEGKWEIDPLDGSGSYWMPLKNLYPPAQTLPCHDCKQVFPYDEAEIFIRKGWRPPTRCHSCRKAKKEERREMMKKRRGANGEQGKPQGQFVPPVPKPLPKRSAAC